MMLNALTIDLEDYFQVSNFEGYIPKQKWHVMPLRIEYSTMKLLDILSQFGVKATFFVLGWIAERMGLLIRKIDAAGHEIASHGYDHRIAYNLTPDEFRDDLVRSKTAIEYAIGKKISGYRATSYSVVRRNIGYLRILAEEGFCYDSSIFPVYHDRYGIPDWDRFPTMIKEGDYAIYEVPPSTYRIGSFNLPIAGGGYLRLFPVRFLAYCIDRINKIERSPAVMYIHPWEIDTGQPKIRISFKKAFRHYNNLDATEEKLTYLLNKFRFGTVSEMLGNERST